MEEVTPGLSSHELFTLRFDDFAPRPLNVNGQGHQITRRKSKALVMVLASMINMRDTRARLASMLWSDATDANARQSLRQELRKLRDILPRNLHLLIDGTKHELWLNTWKIERTGETVIAGLKSGIVDDIYVTHRYLHEIYLSEFRGIDSELDLWISAEQANFEQRSIAGLQSILADCGTNSHQLKEKASKALVHFDPSDEIAICAYLQCLLDRGSHGAAQRAYNAHCDHMSSELDLPPCRKATAIMQKLSQQQPTRSAVEHAADAEQTLPNQCIKALVSIHTSPTGRSLIIADKLIGSESGGEAIVPAQAVRMDLLGTMARFRDWSVRERNPHAIVEADHWFELRFAPPSNTVNPHLTISLVAQPNEEILWSDRVDLDRYGGLQHQAVMRGILTSLNIEISAQRIKRAVKIAAGDRGPHDRWLLANQNLQHWRAQDEAKAESEFRAILSKWPDHAPSLASLAEILNTRHLIFPGVMPCVKRSGEALDLSRRAVRINPQDSRLQLALGWSHLMTQRGEQASYFFDTALRLNRSDPETVISTAMGLCYCGEFERATEIAEEALSLGGGGEPVHWAYQACIHYYCKRFENALNAADMAHDSTHFIDAIRAAAMAALGDEKSAKTVTRTFVAKIGQDWFAAGQCTPKAVGRWLVQSFPIHDAAAVATLEDHFKTIGLS